MSHITKTMNEVRILFMSPTSKHVRKRGTGSSGDEMNLCYLSALFGKIISLLEMTLQKTTWAAMAQSL
jgi:hypothetical protein